MVTGNIRDFVLLPLLEAPGENKLYDILSETYIKIPDELYDKIHADTIFEDYFKSLVEKVENLGA